MHKTYSFIITLFIISSFPHLSYSMWTPDPDRDLDILEKSLYDKAEMEDCEAQYQYGCLLFQKGEKFPEEVEHYHEKARDYFWLSGTKLNHPEANYYYALMCANGQGGEKSEELARSVFQRGIQLNHPNSIFEYARMLDQGKGGPQDLVAAVSMYELAAQQGHAGAMFNLAGMLRTGEGCHPDLFLSRSWYQECAKISSIACFNYAMMCFKGLGGEKNMPEAANYFQKAYEFDADPEACFYYAFICEHLWQNLNGVTDENHLNLARKYYLQCIEKKESAYYAGKMALFGEGGDQDTDQSIHLLEPLTLLDPQIQRLFNGEPLALFAKFYCATAYFQKYEDPQNEEKLKTAQLWFDQVASQMPLEPPACLIAKTQASYNHALMCEKGLGESENLIRARTYYQSAAESGHVDAIHKLIYFLKNKLGRNLDIDPHLYSDDEFKAEQWINFLLQNGIAYEKPIND